jgi:hypothetical protein
VYCGSTVVSGGKLKRIEACSDRAVAGEPSQVSSEHPDELSSFAVDGWCFSTKEEPE